MTIAKGPVKAGGRVNVALKLRLRAGVKRQLEILAAERGETISETVTALVALAYWRDGGQVSSDLPARAVRAALAKARRSAKGRRAALDQAADTADR